MVVKQTIEGLSHSGEHYLEANSSLQVRYNHPRITHQMHIKRIFINTPPAKNGSWQGALQTPRRHTATALKLMEYDLSRPF